MPLGHPAVVSVLAGARTPDQMSEYPDLLANRIPLELRSDLRAAGCLAPDIPVPAAPAMEPR
jgi:D-threo-aldose 1-dehydrogenase